MQQTLLGGFGFDIQWKAKGGSNCFHPLDLLTLNQSSDFQGGIIQAWGIFDTSTLVKYFFRHFNILIPQGPAHVRESLTENSHKCEGGSAALVLVSEAA